MNSTILSTAIGNVLRLTTEREATKQVNHNMIIIDRSLSMGDSIDTIISQIKQVLLSAPMSDIFTVAWFAGEGQHGIALKGSSANATTLKMIDKLNSTVGYTCFSEVLDSLISVASEFKDLVSRTTVNIFTDGQPVVHSWSNQTEETRAIQALNALVANGVDVVNAMGYSYYNEKLMRNMVATAPLGKLMHLAKVADYGEILGTSLNLIEGLTGESLEISTTGDVLFVNGAMTMLNQGSLTLKNTNPDSPVYVLLTEGQKSLVINGETVDLTAIQRVTDEIDVGFYYALASAHYYNGDSRVLDALYASQDKYLINKVETAFSNNERSQAQQMLTDAISLPEMRYLDGKSTKSFDSNAAVTTFFDLLNVLSATDAEVTLNDYKATTRGSVVVKNHFVPDVKGVNFKVTGGNIVFNKTRLNVSVLTTVKGHVELSDADAKLFYGKMFDCSQFRTYTLIRDGEYNVEAIDVKVLNANVQAISDMFDNAITKQTSADGYTILTLNLLEIPKTSRKEQANNTADFYFDLNYEMLVLEAQQKVANDLISKFETAPTFDLTPAQVEVLEKYGVNAQGTYAPKSVAMSTESCDWYETKTVEFKFKGSTLPKVADVKSGKSKTFVAKIMLDFYNLNADKSLEELTAVLADIKNQLKQTRLSLARAKFAMLLTGGFINGLTKDGADFTFVKNGVTMKVEVDYKKEYINAD